MHTTTRVDRNGDRYITRTTTNATSSQSTGVIRMIQSGAPADPLRLASTSQQSRRSAGPRVMLHSSNNESPRMVPLMELFEGLNLLLMAGLPGEELDPQDPRLWSHMVEPASPEQIDNLPVTQVGAGGVGAQGGSGGSNNPAPNHHIQCMICLSDYKDGESVRTLPCGHVYHKECVDRWLAINHNCPACKAPIA